MADDKPKKKTTSVSITTELYNRVIEDDDCIADQLKPLFGGKIRYAAPIINALISTFDLKEDGDKIVDYIKNVHNKEDGRVTRHEQKPDDSPPITEPKPKTKSKSATNKKSSPKKKSVVSKTSKVSKWAKDRK